MDEERRTKPPNVGDLVACYVLSTSMSEPELMDLGLVMDTNRSDHKILVQSFIIHKRYWWSDKIWKVLSPRQ